MDCHDYYVAPSISCKINRVARAGIYERGLLLDTLPSTTSPFLYPCQKCMLSLIVHTEWKDPRCNKSIGGLNKSSNVLFLELPAPCNSCCPKTCKKNYSTKQNNIEVTICHYKIKHKLLINKYISRKQQGMLYKFST